MLGADGEYRWFQVRGAPLLDRDQRVLRWYAVITDIEEAKRAREALLRSQARLARMSQITTIAELSASIAHEVNQPLAAILANANACLAWLSADPPNLARARATAGKTIGNADSAAEVVRRMRALFKQSPPAIALSDMNDTVREVLNLIGNEFRDADITVETELAADLPVIAVDRIQVQQVLINLAHNAIEALEGVTGRPRRLSLVTQCDGVDILIQVRDGGRGIANPALIFDPFFTTKDNGMGMGRSIVEMHGGRLWATANKDAGTTLSFTLPLHPDVPR
jgi:C4-dicarboxylate-specific signal transduction histidine kinase